MALRSSGRPTAKHPLEHIVINDFRYGIVSNIRAGASGGGIFDAPKPGMAQEGTIGCIANETGQLVPLPIGQSIGTVTCGASGYTPSGPVNTCGVATAGPIYLSPTQTYNDDIFIITQFIGTHSAASYEYFQTFVVKPDGSNVTAQLFQGLAGTTIQPRGCTFAHTRARTSNFTNPGSPLMAWEVTSGRPFTDGSMGQYLAWPDPASPTVDFPYAQSYTVNGGSAIWGGQILAHDGRILRLAEQRLAFGSSAWFETNELVRYTDPPNSLDLSTNATDSVLDPQIPGGYGSWGSITFGELLLVKRSGGALLIMGDVYAPQITRLEGIASVGDMMNKATSCPDGMIYCVENDGAYMWAGGATSQKINTINDQFHTMDVLMQFGRKCDHTLWNNWVVFSNGWLYDSVNNSWWQLLDNLFTGTASRRIQWLAAGKGSAQYLWCVGGSGKNSNSDPNIEYVRYDRSTQGQSYTWISQPLPVSLMQTIDVHEIEIGITNVSPNTQLLIQLDTIDGTTSSSEPVIIHNGSSRPIRVRLPIGIRGNSITVTYSVSGPGPAPTTNEIIVGYMEAGPYGQAPGQEP